MNRMSCPVTFLLVPCVGLQFVIMVFPDHTHLLFEMIIHVIIKLILGFKTLIDLRLGLSVSLHNSFQQI